MVFIPPAESSCSDCDIICDRHGLLLMLDEIQCGLGRMGNWCGWKEIVGEEFRARYRQLGKGNRRGISFGRYLDSQEIGSTFDGAIRLTSVTCCNLGVMERPSEVLLLPARPLWRFWRRLNRMGCSQTHETLGDYAKRKLGLSQE